jgi:hypothetical protein
MNVHTNPKSVTMTPEEAVAKIADEYAKAEKYLTLAYKALGRIPGLYTEVHKAKAIGFLETQQRSARIKVAAGIVAQAELAVADAHVNDTGRAQELGIDIPVVFSGPGR